MEVSLYSCRHRTFTLNLKLSQIFMRCYFQAYFKSLILCQLINLSHNALNVFLNVKHTPCKFEMSLNMQESQHTNYDTLSTLSHEIHKKNTSRWVRLTMLCQENTWNQSCFILHLGLRVHARLK